jgi:hypothetical protein
LQHNLTADGAYDCAPTYQTIAQHGDSIEVVIPPRATAIPNGDPDTPRQRDRHLAMIAEQGRLAWQASTGYGQPKSGSSMIANSVRVGRIPGHEYIIERPRRSPGG